MDAWKQELNDWVRAFCGAYIFGVPLLFTMEMWWIGEHSDITKLVAFLLVALTANFGLSFVAGFKRESTFSSTLDEAIDAVAVGILAAAIVLFALNQVHPSQPLQSNLGRILLQAVPLSIGASVANQVFGTNGEKSREGEEDAPDPQMNPGQALLADVGATIIGGIFVGFSIAPTDEVPMLAAALDFPHLLGVIAFSLLASYCIVFASGFDEPSPDSVFQHPLTETMLAYLVSLAISFGILVLFGQIALDDPLLFTVEQTLVLAVPATIGGAAGRLVI